MTSTRPESDPGAPMDTPAFAFPAKALAELLTRQAALMKLYKEAARRGAIKAVVHGGANLVLIGDAGVLAEVRRLAPDLEGMAWEDRR